MVRAGPNGPAQTPTYIHSVRAYFGTELASELTPGDCLPAPFCCGAALVDGGTNADAVDVPEGAGPHGPAQQNV